ncbi:Protein NSP-INTERACTING KINASE 3 [Platanthera guangdongensis]|uniref:non-specific serine/threonine protein kinase n=1 Tax=Platanthera guangdongensis TaxID=2320717 RepID=A0ABR2LZM8_9ASPA
MTNEAAAVPAAIPKIAEADYDKTDCFLDFLTLRHCGNLILSLGFLFRFGSRQPAEVTTNKQTVGEQTAQVARSTKPKTTQVFSSISEYLPFSLLAEIKKATGSFSMIIRSDSVGIVYRARFSDGLITTIIKIAILVDDGKEKSRCLSGQVLQNLLGSTGIIAEDNENREAVFQFGVLILELITGQSMGGEDEALRWVQGSGISCSMHKMVDADLGGNYDSRELKSFLIIARLCTKVDDESAVSIPQILRYLQGKMDPAN